MVDADLSKYFDTIPHTELLKSVTRRIVDRDVLHLIKMWLKVPVEEREADGKRRMTGGRSSRRGTPQGGIVSPLLANLYMNRFLKHWRITGKSKAFRAQVVTYADDFVILSRRHAAEALDWTRSVITQMGLVWLAAAAFLLAVLIINHDLFLRPIFEHGDYAANAIQIQNAKHFREMLGNYSRWRFHHPGPAFFYIFALGETVLHDWFHLAPDALNAHILTIIVLNTVFLFACIGIFAQDCRSPLFVPAAVVAALVFISTINRTFIGSALLSIWMPYVFLFCLLLYVTACASVSTGKYQHLPIAVLTGLMLVHAHIAQVMFVSVIGSMMAATVILRRTRHGGVRTFLVENRKSLLISGALVALFAIPPLLDVMLHKPSNIAPIRVYLSVHQGPQNSWMQSLKYETSFFTFLPDPEVVLLSPKAGLLAKGCSHPYVVKYWGLWVLLLGIVAGLRMRGRVGVSPFLKHIMLEVVVVSMLFWYWGTKIAGGLYNFNGYFFYSVQLLILLVLLSLILGTVKFNVRAPWILLLSCAAPVLMFAAPPYYRNALTFSDDVNRIASGLERQNETVQITFADDDWPTAVGIASRLKRVGKSFCVAKGWGFMFGYEAECKDMSGLTRLVLTHHEHPCVEPCRTIFQGPEFTAELAPYPSFKVPFTLGPDFTSILKENFYGPGVEGDPMWASKNSTIRFLAAQQCDGPPILRVRIIGSVQPGRPVQVRLNGHELGTLAAPTQHSFDFHVHRNMVRAGSDNQISFSVENAGPLGNDPRDLGFWLERIEFAAADSSGSEIQGGPAKHTP